MNTSNNPSKIAGAGLLAAIVASLCCITPVLSLFAGIGSVAATFSWMELFRPYLIAITITVMGFAWYQKLKLNKSDELHCDCEEDNKPSFWQSKRFLGIVTLFAALMLTFPSYSHLFYSNINQQLEKSILSSPIKIIDLEISGMTCTGCEEHVKHVTIQVEGVIDAQVSFEEGQASVSYDPGKVSEDRIVDAINVTGYQVIGKKEE